MGPSHYELPQCRIKQCRWSFPPHSVAEYPWAQVEYLYPIYTGSKQGLVITNYHNIVALILPPLQLASCAPYGKQARFDTQFYLVLAPQFFGKFNIRERGDQAKIIEFFTPTRVTPYTLSSLTKNGMF